MNRNWSITLTTAACLSTAMLLTISSGRADETIVETCVQARTPEDAGRFLIRVGGCNDCHTPGFAELGEKVPESLWLTGVPVGWRGPWGTTYASNLRLFIKPFSEDDFVKVVRAANGRPPMPWTSLHAMNDQDLRAVYRYIKSLGAGGEQTPQFVPPGQEPATPYINAMPVSPQPKAITPHPAPKTP